MMCGTFCAGGVCMVPLLVDGFELIAAMGGAPGQVVAGVRLG